MSENIHVILNPISAGGKTKKVQSQILDLFKKYFGCDFTVCIIEKDHQAQVSTKNAIKNGSDLIIVVGGDGTIQDTVNGFFENGQIINPECKLGIINSGTGCGFAQSLGLPSLLEKQISIIKNGRIKPVDVGKVRYRNNGDVTERYFINECQIGIGGHVVKNVKDRQKKLGGFLTFGLTTLYTCLNHPNQNITFKSDNSKEISESLTGIVISNGRYTGGGMKLTPFANLDDGLLDVLLIHHQSKSERLLNATKIYSGKHINSKLFSYFHAKHIEIKSEEDVLLEADGELLDSLPCEINILPLILKVCV